MNLRLTTEHGIGTEVFKLRKLAFCRAQLTKCLSAFSLNAELLDLLTNSSKVIPDIFMKNFQLFFETDTFLLAVICQIFYGTFEYKLILEFSLHLLESIR